MTIVRWLGWVALLHACEEVHVRYFPRGKCIQIKGLQPAAIEVLGVLCLYLSVRQVPTASLIHEECAYLQSRVIADTKGIVLPTR